MSEKFLDVSVYVLISIKLQKIHVIADPLHIFHQISIFSNTPPTTSLGIATEEPDTSDKPEHELLVSVVGQVSALSWIQ